MEDCAVSSYYEKILATGEVKCIDEEVPFEIPQGWEWCRLGEISTYALKKRKINASNADTQLWGLDLEDIEKGGRLLNIKTVGERKAIGDKTVFNRGDILYSKLRPYLLKILVAPEGGICTPEIIPFTCYGNICKDYIVTFLKSPYVDDYINSATFGVKMPRVSTETMTSLLVPLPPLSEQFRIDTKAKELMPYIDEYGKAQDKLNKLNEELSYTIRKSILQEAIQGKLVPQIEEEGNARELLEQIKTEKQKLVKEGKLKKSALNDSVIYRGDDNKYWEKNGKNVVCIDEEIPFEIPNNWNWCRLKDIGKTETGTTPSKLHPEYFGNYIPFLSPANIFGSKIISETQGLSNIGVQFGRVVPKNSILQVCIGGSIGKCAIVNKPTTFNQQINSITPYFCNVEFVHIVLQSEYFRLAIIDKATGTATPIINRGNWETLLFPLPPLKEQQRIIEKYKGVTSIMSWKEAK
ncbi:MAG: restriction endonuclease subunit S [Bacteroidales bacterium]